MRTLPGVAAAVVLTALVPSALPGASGTSSYEYDELNRLIAATLDGSRIEYVYDPAGNITRVSTPYVVSVSKIGPGSGSVTDDLGKLDCGDDCDGVYDLNTLVTLTATPDGASLFDGWSGACAGTSTCAITVDEVEQVTATFVALGADLEVTKTDGLAESVPGQQIEYTVVVQNNGPSPVADALVEDTIPTELTCTWTSEAAGSATGSAGAGAGSLSETLSLPTGASMTYTFTCDIDPAATGALSNTASVSTAVADPMAGNESQTDDTTLTPAADLTLAKSASALEVGVGATVTYTIEVTSTGPSTAVDLVMVDVLPPGVTFVSALGTDWACGEDGGTVTCERAALGPGESTDIELVVTMPSTPGAVLNAATVSSVTPEAAAGDETDEATVVVYGPPTIISVGSVASTEAGELTPGFQTSASLTQLILKASHELQDPVGDSEPTDVTNPEAYRLFRADPNGDLPALTCDEPSQVAIGAVSYGLAGPRKIAVPVTGVAPLDAGLYRLMLCSSGPASIEDVFGNALDGNGDGIGGDAFEIDFEVRVTNLLVNPNFDSSLDGWQIASETPGDVAHDPLVDTSAAATSGSVSLRNLTGSESALEISQCVSLAAGESYTLGGEVRTHGAGELFPEVRALVEFFEDLDCAGTPLDLEDAGGVAGPSSGFWFRGWSHVVAAPAGAVSAKLTFRVTGDEQAAEAWLDDIQLYFTGLAIFLDGFESGDSSAWD